MYGTGRLFFNLSYSTIHIRNYYLPNCISLQKFVSLLPLLYEFSTMTPETVTEKNVITNRKAHYDYFIIETYEAGIALKGTEVKSLRQGNANLQDSYAAIKNGEVWLHNMHISPFEKGNINNHEPKRDRKLLLHKQEIRRLIGRVSEKGLTLVPLRVYFKNKVAKVEIGLAKGKKHYDKREAIAKRDIARQLRREFAR